MFSGEGWLNAPGPVYGSGRIVPIPDNMDNLGDDPSEVYAGQPREQTKPIHVGSALAPVTKKRYQTLPKIEPLGFEAEMLQVRQDRIVRRIEELSPNSPNVPAAAFVIAQELSSSVDDYTRDISRTFGGNGPLWRTVPSADEPFVPRMPSDYVERLRNLKNIASAVKHDVHCGAAVSPKVGADIVEIFAADRDDYLKYIRPVIERYKSPQVRPQSLLEPNVLESGRRNFLPDVSSEPDV